MSQEQRGHEHEFEPQFGLPERLPANERILWQGSPDVSALARSAFHLHKLGLYFALLLVARAASEVSAGASAMGVLLSLKWLAPLALTGLLIVWTLAWLTARTTVYTLTNKRVVMRLGIVLTVSFNLPLSRIAAADLRALRAGHGDITLALKGEDRIAWVHLWPSVRPWRIAHPEPTLRAIPGAAAVAAELSAAWSAASGQAATPAPSSRVQHDASAHGLQVSAS
ncbi:MAG: photosynthetic complex putative assembly protein PuhB [Rhodoferax sp.]|nr:photosynthetic complex putative assembly protein PuhB [Rhodoferax sp.]